MAEGDYPDVEGGIRDYLLADVSVSAATSGGFFAIPDTPTFPLFVVSRVGGGDDPSEAAIDRALIQIDVWGPTRQEKRGGKAAATALMNAIRRALHGIRSSTQLNTGVSAYGATVESVVSPWDPHSDRPRYAMTVQVIARTRG
jgi:hypothetical protein